MAARKPKQLASVNETVTDPKRPTTESPLVFISHDSRDADLAEAFANLLTDASGGILKSFRSSDRKGTTGIEFGEEWYSAIMTGVLQTRDELCKNREDGGGFVGFSPATHGVRSIG